MDKLKRRLAILGIFIALGTYCATDPIYHPQYEILDSRCEAFAEYSCGKVYIGNKSFLKKAYCHAEDGDIFVEDQRHSEEDPNMKIYASCFIHDAEIRNEILEILQEYEKQFPSDWDRTIESMRLEWLMHNLSYIFTYQQHRTEDVDLNNEDEEYYNNKILQKIFHV